MYRLRHAAGKDAILFEGDDLYLFNRAMDYEYDVEAFGKEIAQAEKTDNMEQREEHLKNAAHHYRGKFLPDVDTEWAGIQREQFSKAFLEGMLDLATHFLDNQEYEKSIEYCELALKEDPCNEEAHRTAMMVHAAQHNRALVVRQYDLCCQVLDEELGVNPSNQTRKLYESLIK
jgi:DNA-binding SARP family transcriptional activator